MLNDTPTLNTQEQMYQANQMEHWQVIASGVAHDFNNLLTSILGQSSLALLQLPEDTVARHHIEKVIKAAEYAATLTDRLLTFSQGNQTRSEPFSINQLLQDNLNLLDTTFLDGITLDVHMSPNLPLFVGERGQIQQIVMNLLINAAEAIHPAPGTIFIRTGVKALENSNGNGRFAHHNQYIFLQIQDNGSGIDPANLSHIFEPHFTTKPNGRGLGLSAVKEIVQQYQGYLDIHSQLGQGTTITVYLPANKNLSSPDLLL